MTPMTYLIGDATDPVGGGSKIIAHVVNDVGVWEAGFTEELSKRWPVIAADYRGWHAGRALVPIELCAADVPVFVYDLAK